MHDALMLFSERLPKYVVVHAISGGRTKQLDIIADFLPHHWLYERNLSAEKVHRYMRRA